MLGLYVTIPIACFRKGLAREYLETEPLPPPATCYGFLLSLVGETRRSRHVGCRVCPVLLNEPEMTPVLRTLWRIKDANYYVDPTGKVHVVSSQKKQRDKFEAWVRAQGWPSPEYEFGLGCGTNLRPDYQQLLAPVELLIWLDSSEEQDPAERLERLVQQSLENPASINRFGGLSFGESTHLVDQVKLFPGDAGRQGTAFLLAERGPLTLPVWVDHVGSAGTRHVTGDLESVPLTPPPRERMPRIEPKEPSP
jgi:CRISPR-associated protein Cas5t